MPSLYSRIRPPLPLPTSNVGWTDSQSFSALLHQNTTAQRIFVVGRNGNNSYYRVAIAAGKSIPFPQPNWAGQDFGTDGGMHNFLRYLEDRSANKPVAR